MSTQSPIEHCSRTNGETSFLRARNAFKTAGLFAPCEQFDQRYIVPATRGADYAVPYNPFHRESLAPTIVPSVIPHPPVAPLLLSLADERATTALGARLAGALAAGVQVQLRGELGTGKTTLVRGCLRALGYVERVKSPSYSLVEPYKLSKLSLYHFDFYRLREPTEWLDAGFRDYFNDASVCLVEWPEMAGDTLPLPDLQIHLEHAGQARKAMLKALSPRGEAMLRSISSGDV